jgi:hypothetical protein
LNLLDSPHGALVRDLIRRKHVKTLCQTEPLSIAGVKLPSRQFATGEHATSCSNAMIQRKGVSEKKRRCEARVWLWPVVPTLLEDFADR